MSVSYCEGDEQPQPAVLSLRAAARHLRISRRQVMGAVGRPLVAIQLGERQYVTRASVLAFERFLSMACGDTDALC
jgi:hypothetical protein